MIRKVFFIFSLIFVVTPLFSQEKIGISGVIDWESMEIKSVASLDLASAGLRLPTGRNQAESILSDGYIHLVRQAVLKLQVDSSSAINDLLDTNELTLPEIDIFSALANSVAPSLAADMRSISASYVIPVMQINNALQRHRLPSPVSRTLNPVSTPDYTGIVIIASERLPSHGTRSSLLPVPCLFPKIWDTEMNLIYDRNMVTPNTTMVRYSSPNSILANTPSGLTPELQNIVGDRPLRIFAKGVFGIKPTDLIIDRTDALLIISNEQNRNLLTQGKVVIILDSSVLRQEFSF